MSSIVDQVRDVQDQLRNQAERLGDLNLKSNNFIEMNQKLALQIVDLKNKLAKKKHMIEQQNKDKMLIHQKLIKAQREKQLLQIQNHRKQQQKQKQIQKQGSQMNTISRPITNHIQTLTLGEELNMGQKVAPKQNNQQDTNQTKQQQSLQDTKNTEKYQQPTQPQPQNHGEQYTETDRGEYQPPMLFQENQQNSEEKQQKSDDQDSAQDQDQEILNKLRATVKDEEDEDDEDQS